MWHGRDVLEYNGFFSSFGISLGEEKNTMYIMLIISFFFLNKYFYTAQTSREKNNTIA